MYKLGGYYWVTYEGHRFIAEVIAVSEAEGVLFSEVSTGVQVLEENCSDIVEIIE